MAPYETSESIVPHSNEEIRLVKRYRIEYDQANEALEAPSTYDEAINSPQAVLWKKAIDEELNAFMEKKTWTAKEKKVSQKKVRLVLYGNRQAYGFDDNETYFPVANINSI
uniref:AlNc14C682G12398 protein n=1 Tax=Albugo laibachii Nc14 TaxID=890382 RepID=F0X1T3_9STRA|nr:AlNc14C682G12398 [Albugo laibachii Nc14]|eukprot:CCA27787.1 AlNc14C682G12398 [Albugo laibachii Nc14]